jgi:hypothetical protein
MDGKIWIISESVLCIKDRGDSEELRHVSRMPEMRNEYEILIGMETEMMGDHKGKKSVNLVVTRRGLISTDATRRNTSCMKMKQLH